MPTVKIEPTRRRKVPYDPTDTPAGSFMDEVVIAANTAELQVAMGAPLEVDARTAREESDLLRVFEKKELQHLSRTTTSYAAAAFLREYGQQLAVDVNEVRAALTHKLLEIANCGDVKFELRAIELLGKHSDIGLFTTRSEITINHRSPEALEEAIKDRVKRLLHADIIDNGPAGIDLDEELGVFNLVKGTTESKEEVRARPRTKKDLEKDAFGDPPVEETTE